MSINKPATLLDKMLAVFNGHINDLRAERFAYHDSNLQKAVVDFPSPLHARRAMYEFATMAQMLKLEVMKCPHPAEPEGTDPENPVNRLKVGDWEQCLLCKCSRNHKYHGDNFERTYFEHSHDIMEKYKDSLSEEEMKVLRDFYEREIPDMSKPENWEAYNSKMKAIFNKYIIWEDWKF